MPDIISASKKWQNNKPFYLPPLRRPFGRRFSCLKPIKKGRPEKLHKANFSRRPVLTDLAGMVTNTETGIDHSGVHLGS
jgi:hypothetical protein